MKYPDKELQECLKSFSSYSEDELIIKMQKTNPECAPHIAAMILLNKKRNKKNRKLFVIAVLTLLVAALTLFAQITGFSWKQFLSAKQKHEQTEAIKSKTEPLQSTVKDVPPANVPQSSHTQQDQNKAAQKSKEYKK